MSISSIGVGVKPADSPVQTIDPETGELVGRRALTPRGVFDEHGGGALPTGNTGVTGSIFDVVFAEDWQSMTIWASHEYVWALLSDCGMAEGLEFTGHGGEYHHELYASPSGVHLYSKPYNEGEIRCTVKLSGRALRNLGADVVDVFNNRLLDEYAQGVRVNCTRLDLAFDTQKFTVQTFVDADRSGLLSCRGRARDEYRNEESGVLVGHTYYVGSRSSERLARVYLKTDGFSFGDGVPFTRVEMELKGERAHAAWLWLASGARDERGRFAAQILNDYMDVQASWWQDFKLSAEKFVYIIRRKTSGVAKKAAWQMRQVAVAFALCVEVYGREWAEKLLHEGRRRFGDFEAALIAAGGGDEMPIMEVYGFDGGVP